MKQRQNQPQSPQKALTALLDQLLSQHKYRQALDEIKKFRRTHPGLEVIPSEAAIWLQRGQHELAKNEFKQAESSLRQALDLGELTGSAYYWLGRTLLQQNKVDAALEVIQAAFEQGTLPKDYAICYPKLLLLKGDTEAVAQLISNQPKRFSAAQLHWLQGVVNLKANKPEQALVSFKKIKRAVTPEDVPAAWIAYTQQQMGNWSEAAKTLGLQFPRYGYGYFRPPLPQEPIMQRLGIMQRAKTGEPPLAPADVARAEPALQQPMTLLALVKLMELEDYHNAAHILLDIGNLGSQWPEVMALRPAVLTLAGDQALRSEEPECTEAFWEALLKEQPFDPQLAVNLLDVLDQTGSSAAAQRLLTRLMKWVEQDKKKNPEQWPGDRFPLTLANLRCRLADTYVEMGKQRAAFGEIKQAERIYPNSPEVIGRKGLMTAAEREWEAAIPLLTQALEQGCKSEEVYEVLLRAWDELDNPQAKLEARRRLGQPFGDLNPEQDVRFEPWLDALYTQRYAFFSRMVQGEQKETPPLRACQIFVEAEQGRTSNGSKAILDQAQATEEWEQLLSTLSEAEQIPVLMAIALSIYLFAKREKGIAALINRYAQRLFELGDNPQAREAHLIVLATKESNQAKLTVPVQSYLNKSPQPGNALAQVQLQVRRFGSIRHLQPFIQEALKREPQNPLLLLALATTHAPTHPDYETLKQQGFDIARRIQDAKALQAFREEEAFTTVAEAQKYMPNPDTFDPDNDAQMMRAMEGMIRSVFGKQIPKAELDRMMPMLMSQMINEMGALNGEDFDDDDDDFDDRDIDLDMIFGNPKKRKSFRDL